MESSIKIRRYSPAGSTVQEVAVEEAERVVRDAIGQGALVVDEETDEAVKGVAESTKSLLIVDPLQGGLV